MKQSDESAFKVPMFSIITVCFNAGSTIRPTLESVDAQTCRLYEHIIVDGASKDDTLAIAAAHSNPLRRVVSEPDRGIYDAMNKEIGRASCMERVCRSV